MSKILSVESLFAVVVALAGLTACGDDAGTESGGGSGGSGESGSGGSGETGGSGGSGETGGSGGSGGAGGEGGSEAKNACPTVTTVKADPTSVDVGGSITLTATADDADNDDLTYAWVTAGGTVDDPNKAKATYDCLLNGSHTLTVIVDDGNGCTAKKDIDVTCKPVSVCGNDKKETGEACDDGNTVACDGCSSDCGRADAECGDDVAECGEACDDGNTANCDGCTADCARADDVCGDDVAECGEVCDDGNTNSCDGCKDDCSRADKACGDSIIECGEPCDDGVALDAPNECDGCVIKDICKPCAESAGVCSAQPAANFYTACFHDSVDQMGNSGMLCAALIACIQGQTNNAPVTRPQGSCVDPTGGGIETCYCGYTVDDGSTPLDPGTCAGGGPAFDAPCVPEVQAAAGNGVTPETDPLDVTSVFVNPAYAIGAASRFVQCMKTATTDCTQECALLP